MARQAEVFRVFISSPSDLVSDRNVSSEAVKTASRILARKEILLEPWLWEEDAVSDYQAPAQSIIELQLGDYDFYIGMMGSQFGCPTGGYGSGTEKEFFDALERQEAGQLKRVAFLFKDVPLSTTALTASSIDQLQKVLKFKEKTQSLGLYNVFSNQADLSNLIVRILCESFSSVSGPLHRTESIALSGLNRLQISPLFIEATLQQIDREMIGRPNVQLDDIWIDPDLQISTIEGKTVRTKSVTPDFMIKEIIDGISFHIHGAETSGKSSLVRKLYVPLLERGLIPILISGRVMNVPDFDRVQSRLLSQMVSQYDGLSVNEARSLDPKKITVLIDDFDVAPVGPKHASKLLSLLRKTYHSVQLVTATSSLFARFETTDEMGELGLLRRVQISELGHKKRYQLIERWLEAQDQAAMSERNFRSQVESLRNDVNRILIRHIVPRTPIIVLILLQALRAKKLGDLAQSGYVRYYKFLIDNLILRNLKPSEAEYAYALLPEIARAIYINDDRRLNDDDTDRLIDDFSKKKALRRTALHNVFFQLNKIGMFTRQDRTYRFRHDYAYHFFLADYINQDLPNPSTAEFIRGKIEGDWSREDVAILVFLSFFSNSSIVVDGLIDKLDRSYNQVKEFDFVNTQADAINRLITFTPREVVDHERSTQQREARLEARDQEERNRPSIESTNDERPLGNLEGVLSAIEVVGHILRNHNARMNASPKQLLYEAATSALLRSITGFYDLLETNLDKLVAYMSSSLKNFSKPEDKEDIARTLLFLLASGFLRFNMRRLAQAVGDEDLELTYRNALRRVSSDTGQTLEVFIQLDCFDALPLREIEAAATRHAGNHVVMAALRAAVAERLDMRPPDNRTFRKLCATLDLAPTIRLLERQRLGSTPDRK